jgi:hypothetical protein
MGWDCKPGEPKEREQEQSKTIGKEERPGFFQFSSLLLQA